MGSMHYKCSFLAELGTCVSVSLYEKADPGILCTSSRVRPIRDMVNSSLSGNAVCGIQTGNNTKLVEVHPLGFLLTDTIDDLYAMP